MNWAKKIEEQILKERRWIDYYSSDYSVELLYNKFSERRDEDKSEIFVPNYQREFRWLPKNQSRFIESILLGIPMPPIFLCDNGVSEGEFFSRLEIVDWSQRIRTINNFLENKLKMEWLKKLTTLNGLYYKDVPENIQNLLKRLPIRVFILSEKTSKEARRDIFDRINTSSSILTPAEVRKWAIWWKLYEVYKKLSESELFKKLCPLSKVRRDKDEGTELVLRFFAYSEQFNDYVQNVQDFLDAYMATTSEKLFGSQEDVKTESEVSAAEESLKNKFMIMLQFVDRHFPNWFVKVWKKTFTSRTYFEAIAVWTQLALEDWGDLNVQGIWSWINSEDFNKVVRSDAANNKSNFEKRILFVKNMLLWTNIAR